MTIIRTHLGSEESARRIRFEPVSDISATNTQKAIEEVASEAAPTAAEYIVGALNGDLSAERLVTNTATVEWDVATAGQAKANVPNDSITNAILANITQARVKGRADGAGTGDPTDLTAAQVIAILDLNLTRRTADASPVTINASTDDIVIVDLSVEAAVNATFPTVAARIAAGRGRVGLKNGHSNPALYPVTPVRSGSDTIDGTATPLDQDHGRVTWYVPIAATNDWEIQ